MANKHVQFAESLHEQQMKFKPDQVNVAAGTRTRAQLDATAPRTPNVMDGKLIARSCFKQKN